MTGGELKQLVVVLFLSGAVAADWPELQRIEKTGDAMGAMYSIVLYGDDWAKMEAAADAAFDEVGRLDGMLSNYRAGSEWSELNRHAAEGPVKVSPELFELLSACIAYSRESEGAFDITVGPLMQKLLKGKQIFSLTRRGFTTSPDRQVGPTSPAARLARGEHK